MKLYIQKGDLRGVDSELKRLVRPDREYTVELKETARSRKRRLKTKNKASDQSGI
jgi:hypothetical protein